MNIAKYTQYHSKRTLAACAESDRTDARVAGLEADARGAMGLPGDHRVRFTDLHDALTSMRFHGKPIPQVHPHPPTSSTSCSTPSLTPRASPICSL